MNELLNINSQDPLSELREKIKDLENNLDNLNKKLKQLDSDFRIVDHNSICNYKKILKYEEFLFKTINNIKESYDSFIKFKCM